MSDNLFPNIDEDVFVILSHVLRRRILTHLHHQGKISFTLMSKEWKIPTGTIYHHLKLLGNLVEQDDDQIYMLTDSGNKVCDWFIGTNSGKVKISRLKAIDSMTLPIIGFIELHWLLLMVSIIGMFLITLPLLNQMELIMMGPTIIPVHNRDFPIRILTMNLLFFLILMTVFFLILFVIVKEKAVNPKIFTSYIIPFGINSIIIQVINVIGKLGSVTISQEILFLISTLNQFIFIGIVTSVLIRELGFSVERSFTISIFNLYFMLLLSLGLLI